MISLAIFAATTASAANLPAGFTEAQIVVGLASPTAMAFAPDGRLFVAEQGGTLRVIKNGALLATPFASVTVSSIGERGLLGVAIDPDFATDHYVYVYYTATTPAIHNRVSRFTANGDTAFAGSETIVLELNDLSGATNHNGGAMHFGPDGKLYIAVGENANGANAQSLSNLLGKMLRINADGSIPADNPFYLSASGNNRAIWALGLRNPFTFAFQPHTGRVFINDVGQNTWEEIDDGIAGSNYGWPATEGPTGNPAFRSPLYWYGHGAGNFLGCAITGGTFYNPAVSQFPGNFAGVYFFADFCGDWINVFDHVNGNVTSFATGIGAPVDLQVGPDGSVYYLSRDPGAVVRIDYVGGGSVLSRDYVQKAYVAYYGRPADPGGLDYWATRMDREGGSIDAIIAAFGNSEEFNRRYGGLTYAELVTKIYQQALNRDPDPAGLAYYVGELQAGRRTLQTISLDVLNGATTAPDSTVVANKLDVAAYYTGKVAAGCDYGTEQDGVNALSGLTADAATVIAAKAAIDNRCEP